MKLLDGRKPMRHECVTGECAIDEPQHQGLSPPYFFRYVVSVRIVEWSGMVAGYFGPPPQPRHGIAADVPGEPRPKRAGNARIPSPTEEFKTAGARKRSP